MQSYQHILDFELIFFIFSLLVEEMRGVFGVFVDDLVDSGDSSVVHAGFGNRVVGDGWDRGGWLLV